MALKLHPDRNPNCEDCSQKFAKVAEAYKYLLEIRGVEPKKIPTILDDEFDWLAKQKKWVFIWQIRVYTYPIAVLLDRKTI